MNDTGRPNGNRDARRPMLRVIAGGRTRRLWADGCSIVVAPVDTPPFDLDARVVEEDTYRILSADPECAPTDVHPVRLMHELQQYRPDRPGSVVVQAGRPMRLLAVIHDVNQEPTWRAVWIEAALRQVMREAARRRVHSLGLPLLGRQHGRMPRVAFVDRLARVLTGHRAHNPRRMWLMVPALADVGIVFRALQIRLFSRRQNERGI